MKVHKQFSIFLPNRPGEMKKLLYKVKKLNLTAAATFANQDGAILRLIPDDAGSLASLLKQAKIPFERKDVLVLTVPDKPGGLLSILQRLNRAHVNIEGVYIVGDPESGRARCVLSLDDINTAKTVLK